MRLQQLDVDKKPKIMIIPMIDIIFFLLVFFMMSMLTMVVQKSISLNLPQTVTSKLDVEKALPVAVTSDGQIYVEQEKIPRETCSSSGYEIGTWGFRICSGSIEISGN